MSTTLHRDGGTWFFILYASTESSAIHVLSRDSFFASLKQCYKGIDHRADDTTDFVVSSLTSSSFPEGGGTKLFDLKQDIKPYYVISY